MIVQEKEFRRLNQQIELEKKSMEFERRRKSELLMPDEELAELLYRQELIKTELEGTRMRAEQYELEKKLIN